MQSDEVLHGNYETTKVIHASIDAKHIQLCSRGGMVSHCRFNIYPSGLTLYDDSDDYSLLENRIVRSILFEQEFS